MRLQVACTCGHTSAEQQLAATYLFILQQPPADLDTSNCHVCLADCNKRYAYMQYLGDSHLANWQLAHFAQHYQEHYPVPLSPVNRSLHGHNFVAATAVEGSSHPMLEALGETPWLEERVSCALLEASVDIASIPEDVNELQPGSNALQQPSLLSTLLGCLFCWRGLLLLCVAEEASLRANMPCDVIVGHDNVAT